MLLQGISGHDSGTWSAESWAVETECVCEGLPERRCIATDRNEIET